MLGRLAHYTFDAVLVSTLLAGVKRHTGYTPNTDPNAPDPIPFVSGPNAHAYFQQYLSVGEFIFDSTASFAKRSSHFRQTDPTQNLAEGASHLASKLRDESVAKGAGWFWNNGGGSSASQAR
ncbi:unnamed protein product [Parajaminaea phylloscopi]